MRRNHVEELLPLLLVELLGIVQAAQFAEESRLRPARGKHHRRGHHRPGQWTAPRLVHTGHERDALLPKLAFVRQPIPKLRAHPAPLYNHGPPTPGKQTPKKLLTPVNNPHAPSVTAVQTCRI